MLGLLFALLAVEWTGNIYLDGVASIIIGLILAGTAVWLAYETKSLLIGERANQEVVNGVRSLVRQIEGVTHVNEVSTIHMGPDFVLANISLDMTDELPSQTIKQAITEMTRQIKQTHPVVKRVFIEIEAKEKHTKGH